MSVTITTTGIGTEKIEANNCRSRVPNHKRQLDRISIFGKKMILSRQNVGKYKKKKENKKFLRFRMNIFWWKK